MKIPSGVLQMGSRGKLVQDLQRELKAAGFNPGGIDGDFGPHTRAALEAFQRSKHIAVDGVAGKQTWTALGGDKFESGGGSKKSSAPKKSSGSSGGHQVGGIKVTSTMRRLAADARSTAMSMGGYVSHGLCATGVSRTLLRGMGISVYGNGNQIDENLPRSKFRQINIPLSEALKIPGLVLTWEHTSTPAGRIYGHTAITLGDGRESASDFVERDTLSGARSRTGLKIFMPIA